MTPLTKWTCPKCGVTVKAIATQVTHRCPSNKNQHTDFKPEEN